MSVRKVLVTPANRDDILVSRGVLYERLRELSDNGGCVPLRSRWSPGKLVGDSDEIMRQSRILRKQLAEIDSIVDNWIIIQPAAQAEYTGIGVIVTCQRFDADTAAPIGREEEYEIGGYRSTDLKANPPVLSYDAPIAAAMRDLKAGEISADISIAGRKIYLEVRALRLPNAKRRDDEPQLRLVLPNAG